MDTIAKNYIYKYVLIQIDRELFKLSKRIEFEDATLKNDLEYMNSQIEMVLVPWFDYIIKKDCDLNYFGNLLSRYFKEIYCYDFFYINKEVVLNKIKNYTLSIARK